MAYGDIMDRLNDTRPVQRSNYNGFIPSGNHDLVVLSIEPYENQEKHFCVRSTFLVEQSDAAQPGTLFDAIWDMDKPPAFPGGTRDKDRFAAFLNALQGIEPGPTTHHAAARACLKPLAEGGQLEVQPCRGVRIKAIGRQVPIKNGKNAGKPFSVVDYDHVPQKPEDVAKMRAALDQRMPYTPRPQQPAQQAPAPQQTSGWGAPAPQVPVQPAAAPVAPSSPAPAAPSAWAGFFPPK
jgi:hypothetical protein